MAAKRSTNFPRESQRGRHWVVGRVHRFSQKSRFLYFCVWSLVLWLLYYKNMENSFSTCRLKLMPNFKCYRNTLSSHNGTFRAKLTQPQHFLKILWPHCVFALEIRIESLSELLIEKAASFFVTQKDH